MKIFLNFDGNSGNGQKYLESGYILKVKLTGFADGLPDSIVGQNSAQEKSWVPVSFATI